MNRLCESGSHEARVAAPRASLDRLLRRLGQLVRLLAGTAGEDRVRGHNGARRDDCVVLDLGAVFDDCEAALSGQPDRDGAQCTITQLRPISTMLPTCAASSTVPAPIVT